MATMLIKGLINYAKVPASNIIVTRKSKDKLLEISETFPSINIANDETEISRNAQITMTEVR